MKLSILIHTENCFPTTENIRYLMNILKEKQNSAWLYFWVKSHKKSPLSGLKQFLTNQIPLKMMSNDFMSPWKQFLS